MTGKLPDNPRLKRVGSEDESLSATFTVLTNKIV